MSKIQWDSQLYLRYERQRTQPSIDLASKIDLDSPIAIIDLGEQLFQKGNELCTGVTSSGAANDFAAGGVQCCVERKRSVPVVLKAVALSPARAQGQNRIQAVQCLNGALFIHTEHGRIQGRLLIKTDDIESFFFKFRVVARHVAPQPMGLDSSPGPDSR